MAVSNETQEKLSRAGKVLQMDRDRVVIFIRGGGPMPGLTERPRRSQDEIKATQRALAAKLGRTPDLYRDGDVDTGFPVFKMANDLVTIADAIKQLEQLGLVPVDAFWQRVVKEGKPPAIVNVIEFELKGESITLPPAVKALLARSIPTLNEVWCNETAEGLRLDTINVFYNHNKHGKSNPAPEKTLVVAGGTYKLQ